MTLTFVILDELNTSFEMWDQCVGFGVPDEPIRLRRIMKNPFLDDVGIVHYKLTFTCFNSILIIVPY